MKLGAENRKQVMILCGLGVVAAYLVYSNLLSSDSPASSTPAPAARPATASRKDAVAEATHVEIPVAEIREVRVSAEEPRYLEVIGRSDSDLYFLPRTADLEQVIAALRAGNPAVRVTT